MVERSRIGETGIEPSPGDEQGFPSIFRVTDLTYRGHQFLENARSDSRWKRALSSIRDSGKSMSIAVIEAVLVKIATG